MAAPAADAPALTKMCLWIGVSKSGYYEWKDRPLSATAERREYLKGKIGEIFDDNDETYGYRRVHAELARQGEQATSELVRRLMRDLGLVPCQVRKPRSLTTQAVDIAKIPTWSSGTSPPPPPTSSSSAISPRSGPRAVFPDIGGGSFTPTDLGQGAETTADLLNSQAGFDFVLVSFTPGPRRAANIASFQQTMTRFCLRTQNATCVVTDQRPNGVTNYAGIDATPMVLAALLAVIGVAVLGQFIMVSARRRRRDFAIFKTLGMSRRQIRSVTAWQVSTLTGLALLAGLPLGIAAGRWSWVIFARGLGIPDAAITPIGPVLLMVPAVIAVANAVAFWPGRATARLRPAEVLHAE